MKDIRWGWIVVGGLLANVAVALLITPIALIDGYERLGYVAPPASFVGVLVVGYWIARKAPQRALLQGLLVGVFAVLIYVPVLLMGEITLAHLLASGLKVLGGALGGFAVARRTSLKPAATT
jgi:glucose-6-phosphate-specific signal transduction histidine kinase